MCRLEILQEKAAYAPASRRLTWEKMPHGFANVFNAPKPFAVARTEQHDASAAPRNGRTFPADFLYIIAELKM